MSLVDPPLFKTFKPKGSLNELKFQISSLHINDKQDNISLVVMKPKYMLFPMINIDVIEIHKILIHN